MPASRELLELQEVDGDLAARSARLEEIAAALGDDAALRALARRLRQEQAEVDAGVSRQQELDAAVAGLTEKVDAAEAKLYGGTVVNPRELRGLQADVEMLKRQRAQQEESLLETLVGLDSSRSARDGSARELDDMKRSWRAEQRSLAAEDERLRAESAALAERREALVARTPPPETALYEQVRKSRPQPVAQMRNNTCGACKVGVPARTAQEVRSSPSLTRCPNCGRILLPE